MKNNICKVLFVFFFMFVFTNRVFASFSCNNSTIIKEISKASSSGMTAVMPTCDLTPDGHVKKEVHGDIGTLSGDCVGNDYSTEMNCTKLIGDITYLTEHSDIDNKGVVTGTVQLCGKTDQAYIKGTITCYLETGKGNPHIYLPKDPLTYDINCLNDNHINVGNKHVENCTGNVQIQHNCECWYSSPCPEGERFLKGRCYGASRDYVYYYPGGIEDPNNIQYGVDEIGPNEGIRVNEVRRRCLNSSGCMFNGVEFECPDNPEAIDDFYCYCDPTTIKYEYFCPKYICKRLDQEVKMCTASFKRPSTGENVYCVNPGQPFTDEESSIALYSEDTSFNVRDCQTSYSTVDCGYANILIEGSKHNFKSKTIEYALRLWGVHTNQAGFDGKLGISSRKGDNCNERVYYVKIENDGSRHKQVVNTYKKTYEYMSREIMHQVIYKDELNYTSDLNYFTIMCDKSNTGLIGVVCSGSSNEYKKAMALVVNTILGNSKMKEHLSEMFNNQIGEEIKSAIVINDLNDEQYIQVNFEELDKIIGNINKKIECNNLDELEVNGVITDEQRDKLEPFCQVEAAIGDNNNSNYVYHKMDYCYKRYCRVKITNPIICNNDGSQIQKIVKIKYKKSSSSNSIKKYISCSRPGDHQTMFGFNRNASSTMVYKEIPVFITFCGERCYNYNTKINMKTNCNDDNDNYYKTYNSEVKDPSLKCIINMGVAAYRNIYDYSDDFIVNNNICKIYCSDEIKYYIADKVKGPTGRYFYYDIETSVNGDKNIRYLFTNIIKQKRSCVSEIYYDNIFSETFDWKRIYGLESNEGINNWQSLFNAVITQSVSEGNRTENLNKLLYDLYNCNLYTDNYIKNNTPIRKPENSQNANIKKRIDDRFSEENNYGIGQLNNCKLNSTEDEQACFEMQDINYGFAPRLYPGAKMESVINTKISNLSYCNGEMCFKYDSNNTNDEYNYPVSTMDKFESISIPNFLKEEYGLSSNNIKVPINDYVWFSVEVDVSFYNSSKYEVKPNASVINEGSEQGKDYLSLNPFNYPIDKDGYNSNVCSDRAFLNNPKEKRCVVQQKFNRIETFFRNSLDDYYYNIVQSPTNKSFSCYVDVPIPQPECDPTKNTCRLSTTYRNVDPAHIFPSSNTGYASTDSNWGTQFGMNITLAIQNKGNQVFNNYDHMYSITITPEQIKNIKQYNKDNDPYLLERMEDCQIETSHGFERYYNCKSPFIKALNENDDLGSFSYIESSKPSGGGGGGGNNAFTRE